METNHRSRPFLASDHADSRRIGLGASIGVALLLTVAGATSVQAGFFYTFQLANNTGQSVTDLETTFTGTGGTIRDRTLYSPPGTFAPSQTNQVNVNFANPVAQGGTVAFGFQANFPSVTLNNGTWTDGGNPVGNPIGPTAPSQMAVQIPPNAEFEDWGTGFAPNNPITCSAGICDPPDVKSDISPHTHPAFQVDRTATLNQIASGAPANDPTGAEVLAQTLHPGPPCLAMPGEGCLIFKQGDGSVGSLTLDYAFTDTDPATSGVRIGEDSFSVLARLFPGSDSFNIAAFYLDASNLSPTFGTWQFADQYLVDSVLPTFYTFDLPPGTLTTEIQLIYNPLSGSAASGLVPADIPGFTGPTTSSIEAELCCVRSGPVPEIDATSGTGALTLLAGTLGLLAEHRRRPRSDVKA